MREYEGVVARLQSTIKPLLRPHLEDMEKKIAPGFSLLTWTSMNVDGYIHRFKQASPGGTTRASSPRAHSRLLPTLRLPGKQPLAGSL